MEWHITELKALAATGNVIQALWTVSDMQGEFVASRGGVMPIDPGPTPLQYSTVTEAQAIAVVQALLGPEAVAEIEAAVAAGIAAQQNPPTITGLPWIPPPPPPAPPPAPPPSP